MNVLLLAAVTMFLGLTQTGSDGATRLRGTVVGEHNRPVPYADVIAVSGSDVRETRADDRGRYVFLTLFPGVYQLGVHRNVEPAGAAACREADADELELVAGVEYIANLNVAPHCDAGGLLLKI